MKIVALCLLLASPLAAQSVIAGQQSVAYAPSMTFDTNYISGYALLTGNVTSYTIPNGRFGGQVFHLTVCQGNGGPYTVSGQPANVYGDTGLNTNGCTYYRMVWDAPTAMWVTSRIGQAPTPGPKGDTGAQGPQGIAGATGAAGPTGPTGATGAQGGVGATGATGVAGQTGAAGATGPQGAQGVAGAVGAAGPAGSAGVLYYGTSGAVGNVKCWLGTVTSTAPGTFTQSISTAGLTTLLYVNPSVKISTGSAAGTYNAYILSSSTATTINGIVTTPQTVGVLGALAVTLASTAQTVQIEACGT